MEKPCKTMEKWNIDLKIKDLLENLLTKTLMAFQFCQKGFQPDQKNGGKHGEDHKRYLWSLVLVKSEKNLPLMLRFHNGSEMSRPTPLAWIFCPQLRATWLPRNVVKPIASIWGVKHSPHFWYLLARWGWFMEGFPHGRVKNPDKYSWFQI